MTSPTFELTEVLQPRKAVNQTAYVLIQTLISLQFHAENRVIMGKLQENTLIRALYRLSSRFAKLTQHCFILFALATISSSIKHVES